MPSVVEIPVNVDLKIKLEPEEAFEMLCDSLGMPSVLLEDFEPILHKDEWGELGVYKKDSDGKEEKFDDRGELFVALRNVAVRIFPNILFRSANYIYDFDGE